MLTQVALERMLHGLSTRRYHHGLEPVGGDLPAVATSKSSVSRHFVAATRKALAELPARPLGDQRYLVLMLDGIEVADHTVVVALGITADGQKQILGLWKGATENAAVCRFLLLDLVKRGLRVDKGILVVIDGAKALRAAVREVLGPQAITAPLVFFLVLLRVIGVDAPSQIHSESFTYEFTLWVRVWYW